MTIPSLVNLGFPSQVNCRRLDLVNCGDFCIRFQLVDGESEGEMGDKVDQPVFFLYLNAVEEELVEYESKPEYDPKE